MKSIYPPIPDGVQPVEPPTKVEKSAILDALIDGWNAMETEENWQHDMVRCVYALRNALGITPERKREIHQEFLHVVYQIDRALLNEARNLPQEIEKAMATYPKPGSASDLLERLGGTLVPKVEYVKRYADHKVGKTGATWEEFSPLYPDVPEPPKVEETEVVDPADFV